MTTTARIDWSSPAAWAIAGCCAIEAGLNAVGGYDLLGGADGGLKAKVIAAAGVIIAVLGAWMAMDAIKLWRVAVLRPVACVMLAAAVGCFALSQATAWRVLSSSFADGAMKREDKGTRFAELRAEKEKLGVPRPKGSIAAELDLELRNTSKAYPNGDGPKALRLKSELAAAVRAADIEKELEKARAAGAVVNAGAENMIMGKMGVSNSNAIMLLTILLTALIGFFAYFGFAILELTRAAGEVLAPRQPLLLASAPARRNFDPPPPYVIETTAAPQPGAPGGGATNIIHVGTDRGGGVQQLLPPRVAARRG